MSYQISLDDHNNLLTLYEKDILDKNLWRQIRKASIVIAEAPDGSFRVVKNRWEQVGEWALVPGDGRMKIKKVPLIVIV